MIYLYMILVIVLMVISIPTLSLYVNDKVEYATKSSDLAMVVAILFAVFLTAFESLLLLPFINPG